MMNSFDPPSKWNLNAGARDGKRLFRIVAAALVIFGASASSARDLDAENLRRLAQAERNAGNVAAVHLVEAYQAIAITTTLPHSSAREWSESFCRRATNQFMWDRKWRLIVYVQEHDQPAHSCRIPTKPERLNEE